MSLSETLRPALAAGDAVIHIEAALEPASGAKILPPTYAGSVHNMTPPGDDGSSEWCSVDSPASFANRVEEAISAAHPELAPLRVQVGERLISTLEMPHRAFDATLRQSVLDGTPWPQTDIAKALSAATPQAAYPLLQYDPCMILLGGWDSTKLGERKQATRELKLPAALSVEITATDVLPVQRAGSRIDPLGIEGTADNLVEHADGTLEPYDETKHDAALKAAVKAADGNTYPRRVKPSEVNMGNVAPSLAPKGVIVRGHITLNGVLDLRRLAQYRFAPAPDADVVLLLALVGLYGVDAVLRRGLDLRRDCELFAKSATFELLRPYSEPEPLDLSAVVDDLDTALAAVRGHIAEPVLTQADAALRKLAGVE
jgi:CRISPR-associated protein Csb1